MNDYISKPINPAHLFSVLSQWIKHIEGDMGTNSQQLVQSKGQDSGTRLPRSLLGIDLESGLKRLNGNETLYLNLLLDFSKKYASFAEELTGALNEVNIDNAVRLVHTLKGVAGNLSILRVYELTQGLEEEILRKSVSEIAPLLFELDKELKLVRQSVNLLDDQEDKELIGNGAPKNTVEIRKLLLELGRLLTEDNLDAAQCLESLKKQIGKSLFQSELHECERQIRNYDFDAAQQSLRKIALGMNIEMGGL